MLLSGSAGLIQGVLRKQYIDRIGFLPDKIADVAILQKCNERTVNHRRTGWQHNTRDIYTQ